MLERATTFNDTGVIQLDELDFGEEEGEPSPSAPPRDATALPPQGLESTASLDQMEKEHIIKVLRETSGNKKRAAEILGIERRTLYNKAKRLGIDFENI